MSSNSSRLRQGLFLLGSLILTTPVGAQTTPIPAKAYGPVWTGFYVGAAFGGGALVNKVNTSGGASLGLDGLGSSGVLGSIYGGVDYQILPKAIIGVLAEASWSGFQSSASAQLPGAGVTANTSAGLGWSLLGRAGLLANPSTLLYLVGGYTGQNISTSGTAVAGGAVASFSRNDTVHGWTIGPGFETMLTGGWSAKCQRRRQNASVRRSKDASVRLAGRPPAGGLPAFRDQVLLASSGVLRDRRLLCLSL